MQEESVRLDTHDLRGEPGNELVIAVIVLVLIASLLIVLKPFRNRPR